MSSLFVRLAQSSGGLPPISGSHSTLRVGGSGDVNLVDGIKSPDYSLYEDHPQKKPSTQALPTVVWEVAYSQDEKKLAYDLGRHVTCSLGRVRLAIGVNIEHDRPVEGQPRSLKKVTCTFWEPLSVKEFATLEESGSPLDCLVRCDSFAKHDNDYVLPPATRFSCVSMYQGRYMKFFGSQQKLYAVSNNRLNMLALALISRFAHRLFQKTLLGLQPCLFG